MSLPTNTGQSACLDADAGHYVPTTGQSAQTACAAGTYQPSPATRRISWPLRRTASGTCQPSKVPTSACLDAERVIRPHHGPEMAYDTAYGTIPVRRRRGHYVPTAFAQTACAGDPALHRWRVRAMLGRNDAGTTSTTPRPLPRAPTPTASFGTTAALTPTRTTAPHPTASTPTGTFIHGPVVPDRLLRRNTTRPLVPTQTEPFGLNRTAIALRAMTAFTERRKCLMLGR